MELNKRKEVRVYMIPFLFKFLNPLYNLYYFHNFQMQHKKEKESMKLRK